MTFVDVLRTLFEIFAVVALVWCIFHEDRLVAFEEKFIARIRRKRLRVLRNDNAKRHIA